MAHVYAKRVSFPQSWHFYDPSLLPHHYQSITLWDINSALLILRDEMARIIANSGTDREIMVELGARLRALREARGLTLIEVAERATLSRRTVARTEKGDNPRLETLLRLLRVYGRLAALDAFIPEPTVSPMAMLRKLQKGKRRG